MSGDTQIHLRRLLLVGLYFLAAAGAFCQGLRPDGGMLFFVFSLAFGCAMTGWCFVDSRILGRPIITSFHPLIFAAWPLAVPIYLVWSRKLRGFVLALVHAVALFVLSLVLMNLPQYTGYWFADRGYSALVDQDYDRAAQLLGYATSMRSGDATSWYNLGTALQAIGRMDDAVEAYQRALTLDDSEATVWYGLGLAYDTLGDTEAGIEAVEKACSLDPENETYQSYLTALRR